MTRLQHRRAYVDQVRATDLRTPAVERWVEQALDGLTPSLQLAVYRDGDLAVSIAGGHSERDGHITRQSLFLLYSSTKLYTALVMYLLHDRGYFDWDDQVADHWPEFAANGKDAVTIRHVISHRAGIAEEPPATSWPWWGDRATIGRMMERQRLRWEPGSAGGYHNRTYGFILDNLVWRMTGKGIDGVLADEVLTPLGLDDFHFGISRELYDTRFVRTELVGLPRMAGASERTSDRASDEFRVSIGGETMFNAFELARLPLAWGTATATAEAAAELASFHAGRGRHLSVRAYSRDTYEAATAPQNPAGETDQTFGRPARWGLGLQLDGFPRVPELSGAVAHGGGATVHVWADATSGLSAAVILGGLRLDRAAARGGDGFTSAPWQQTFAEAVVEDLLRADEAKAAAATT